MKQVAIPIQADVYWKLSRAAERRGKTIDQYLEDVLKRMVKEVGK